MAQRAVSVSAALLVAGVIIIPVAAVLWRGGGPGSLSPADWAALRFTLWQAALSAALSVALAVPVARALSRRQFTGRALLVTVMGAPFILPVIVAILGLPLLRLITRPRQWGTLCTRLSLSKRV